ncbi:proton-conducting transporter transmembrane domain-containing protein [Candidatus Trichorickettsia mobilis]|uniref:proton-conducting transporter transmembrane domain-containing protein n=1 Tax=Candidatus Trichorickettsia mobilis TaxID=1346319 RepID=UPI0029318EF8|nr:proton-conducting transporter membrane subunit [Candidatus Trichorickettsia mobilis]
MSFERGLLKKIFAFAAILYPIVILLLLPENTGVELFRIFDINLAMHFNFENRTIIVAFATVTIAANYYSLSQQQQWTVIWGGFYFAAACYCLYANDFISLFIALECMMLTACTLIYASNSKDRLLATKQYFITHLTSSSLLLIAISYLIITTNDNQIISLTGLFSGNNHEIIIGVIILTGCLINVAAVPFSSWMVNCYPAADNSSFIYLSTFTTKISIIILIKLFCGFTPLKYFGILMIIYGAFYACKENNLKRLLCYLAIAQLGVIMTVIATNTQPLALTSYITNHIIYNAIFAILVAILADNANIAYCSELKRVKNYLWIITTIIVILMLSNFPLSSSFILKLTLSTTITENLTAYTLIIFNLILFTAIPIREYFDSKEILSIKISNLQLLSIIIPTITMIFINFQLIKTYLSTASSITSDISKQIMIVLAGVITTIFLKISRNPIKFTKLKLLKKMFGQVKKRYSKYQNQKDKFNDLSLLWFITSYCRKSATIHNQQLAIAIVFCLLISMIIIFNIT